MKKAVPAAILLLILFVPKVHAESMVCPAGFTENGRTVAKDAITLLQQTLADKKASLDARRISHEQIMADLSDKIKKIPPEMSGDLAQMRQEYQTQEKDEQLMFMTIDSNFQNYKMDVYNKNVSVLQKLADCISPKDVPVKTIKDQESNLSPSVIWPERGIDQMPVSAPKKMNFWQRLKFLFIVA